MAALCKTMRIKVQQENQVSQTSKHVSYNKDCGDIQVIASGADEI